MPRPLSPVRMPTTRPWSTSNRSAAVSGSTKVPPASACSARYRHICEIETIQLPWFRSVGGGGIRRARVPGQEVDALSGNVPVGRNACELLGAALEEAADGTRVHHRAGEQVRARLLALVDERDGDLAQPLGRRRVLSSSCPRRIAQARPAGPPPTIRTPTSIRSPASSVGDADDLGTRERRRKVRGANARPTRYALRARTSSASLGTTWFRSPTTPKSAKSKIGAFGSLLIATIVPEFCIPTLC